MYLASNTRPDIALSMNLLSRYSNSLTSRDRKGIGHLLQYLQGTQDLEPFYESTICVTLVRYANGGCLSYPHI